MYMLKSMLYPVILILAKFCSTIEIIRCLEMLLDRYVGYLDTTPVAQLQIYRRVTHETYLMKVYVLLA